MEGEVSSDVTYELNVEGGATYLLYAEAYGCFSRDFEVFVEECGEHEVDIEIVECDIADKPNLYLYPETDTKMASGSTTTASRRSSHPIRPTGEGWFGIAHPDGTFTQDGDRSVPLLRGQHRPLAGRTHQREAGWCIDGDPMSTKWRRSSRRTTSTRARWTTSSRPGATTCRRPVPTRLPA